MAAILNPTKLQSNERGTVALVTVEKFLEGLGRSGLMTSDEVHAFMVTLPPFFGEPTIKTLGAGLVRRGLHRGRSDLL